MCGVLSIVSWGGPPVDAACVRAGLEAMRHRGPDGEGIWVDSKRRVGLGHVRLAVIDPAGGAQPITSEDGRVVAAVNGEFYDFERIRGELEGRGHRFATGSDSEILVHLFEERGVDCLEELRGEFAFVLWDGEKQRLFAARDRFGVKPLCWAKVGDVLYIASEAKALFAAGVRAAWDVDAFLHAAHHQYTPPDRMLFEGVFALRPGTYLLASEGQVRVDTYWDIDFPKPGCESSIGAEQAVVKMRGLLEEAVRLRMQADVPVACALSGGLDSSAVAALAARHVERPLACFGVSFEAAPYDERRFAEEVAAHIGAEFHAVEVSQRDLVDHLPEAVHRSEGLAINGHLPAKFLLSRAIHDAGYKVVLTGEGADEAVAGYPHLRQDLWATGSGNGARSTELRQTNRASAGVMMPAGARALSTETVRRRLGAVPTFMLAKAGLGRRIVDTLAPVLRQRSEETCYFDRLLDSFDVERRLNGRHPVDQATYLWSRLALSNYILRTLGDGTEMAHSVEGRTPFLDHHLFEFCQALPLDSKIRGDVEKWVLRRAVEDLLPTSIVARQKHPLLAPPLCVHAGPEIRELLQDTLRSQDAAGLPFFDRAKLLALLDGLDNQTVDERQAVEPVLMTALSAHLLHTTLNLETNL